MQAILNQNIRFRARQEVLDVTEEPEAALEPPNADSVDRKPSAFRMASTKDCGSKLCEMSFQLLPSCTIFSPVDNSFPCDYPCSESNCQTENFHFVECPVWECEEKIPTTASPYRSTTLAPNSDPECSSFLCIGAVIFSAILFIAVLVLISVAIFLKKTGRLHFRQQNEGGNRARLELSDVLRRMEEAPLLEPASGAERGSQREGQDTVQADRVSNFFDDVNLG